MALQHLLNTLLIGGWLYLIAAGFYLASVACRHFNLAVGGVLLLGPYSALWLHRGTGLWTVSAAGSVILCGVAGWAYLILSRTLFRRGARSDQLLVVSLGTLGLLESLVVLLFDSGSRTLGGARLWTHVIVLDHLSVRWSDLIVLVVALGIAIGSLLGWRLSLIGKKLRAMLESRTGLELRGHDVKAVERFACILGFSLVGIAGILWGAAMRIRPAMAIEASVVGIVTYILAPMIAPGPVGLLVSAFGLAGIRLCFNLLAEGDWAMTSNLLLLVVALTVGIFRQRFRRPERQWRRVM